MNTLADLTAFTITGLLFMVIAAIAIFATYVFVTTRDGRTNHEHGQRSRTKQRKR